MCSARSKVSLVGSEEIESVLRLVKARNRSRALFEVDNALITELDPKSIHPSSSSSKDGVDKPD